MVSVLIKICTVCQELAKNSLDGMVQNMEWNGQYLSPHFVALIQFNYQNNRQQNFVFKFSEYVKSKLYHI